MTKKSFSIHSDFYNELLELDDKDVSELIKALIKWANNGEKVELSPVGTVIFRLMTGQI